MNCFLMKGWKPACFSVFFSFAWVYAGLAQPGSAGPMSPDQGKAIELINTIDTSKASAFWPNISAADFYQNVKANILYPEIIFQGRATNFCGYSALTVAFCKDKPLRYTQLIVELYKNGIARIDSEHTLKPSVAIRDVAGTLQGKGKLILNPADQLWMLSLADHFKGYSNFFDKKYKRGDENAIWASTTFGKFNRMTRILGNYQTKAWGSDLIKPKRKINADFLKQQLEKGKVILYVNSKYLHPSKFRLYNLRAPCHYIILYNIETYNGTIVLKYWDYGLKTLQVMTGKRLKRLVFGIVRFNQNSRE